MPSSYFIDGVEEREMNRHVLIAIAGTFLAKRNGIIFIIFATCRGTQFLVLCELVAADIGKQAGIFYFQLAITFDNPRLTPPDRTRFAGVHVLVALGYFTYF